MSLDAGKHADAVKEAIEQAATDRDPPETAGSTPRARMARRGAPAPQSSRPVRYTALALVLISALSAVWFGVSWYAAATDPDRAFAVQRDAALQAGSQAVINLNTLDYRDVDGGLAAWQASATAELYTEIASGADRLKEEVGKAKTVTTARILDAALTELDLHAGKARIIAAVEITVQPDGKEATIKQNRYVGELTKTAEGWKLSDLGQATTGAAQPGATNE